MRRRWQPATVPWEASTWTYSTVAPISGKKLSNLTSIDVGVHIAISHFAMNRLFSPGFCPAEPLKSTEIAGHCQGRTLKRQSSVRYCRLSHVPFCRSNLRQLIRHLLGKEIKAME